MKGFIIKIWRWFQVGIEGITYAGNHGLEILHPDGSQFVHPMPLEYEDKVTDLLKALQKVSPSRNCVNVSLGPWTITLQFHFYSQVNFN